MGHSPPRHLLDAPNATAIPSTASVPIAILLYNGPLLCSYSVRNAPSLTTFRHELKTVLVRSPTDDD